MHSPANSSPFRMSGSVRLADVLCIIIAQESLILPLQFTWRRGSDMPFQTGDYVQSAVVQGKLYVGGGFAGPGSDNNYMVMVYDISSREWATLPPYIADAFAMTMINHHLVLVGGDERNNKGSTKKLGVWKADHNAWTHPYPEMPTARYSCSAVVYKDWLIVAGGYVGRRYSSCVEVLNTDSKQWYAGPPTPTPWSSMKTAVVGDMAYFMGGNKDPFQETSIVYCACVPTLISHITSMTSVSADRQIWKEIIPGLQLTWSTPLSMTGSLLAVGGWDKDGKAVTAIHYY